MCVATPPCETLMSENERPSQTNAVINDKLQGTVVTYLRYGGIFNNQIKKGLLLSMPVKEVLKSVNMWHSYGQKGRVDCVAHFLQLLAVWWPGAESARDNHVLACDFVNFFHWQTQE